METQAKDVACRPWNGIRATVRLQFRQGFTFADAVRLIPYFDRLGISHIYASPLFRSRPDSTHGYDVLDYSCIEPDLGGEEGLRHLVNTLRQHEMGLILDIVPNHMAVGGAGNRWWEDVLAWGRESSFARFFDIAWDDMGASTKGRLILPFLDRPYGQALADGLLRLEHDRESGFFFVYHHEHRFSVCPAHYADLLKGAGAMAELCRDFALLAQRGPFCPEGNSCLQALSRWFETEEGQQARAHIVNHHAPNTQAGRERLHVLIQRQVWSLKWWRNGSEILNWRRFFDNTGLGGLAVERTDVFDAVHEYAISLYARGLVDGFRVDHIDGLAAPAAYCARLRERLKRVAKDRPEGLSSCVPIYVEKILEHGESLPAHWGIDGSTGYDFMDEVSAVLHDASGAVALDALFRMCEEGEHSFVCLNIEARGKILSDLFAAEFGRLVARLMCAEETKDCDEHDDTLTAMATVVRMLLLHFNPYRTYYSDDVIQDHSADRRALAVAVEKAKADLPSSRHELLDRLVECLAMPVEKMPAPATRRAQMSFEHLTAPLAAKSLEDTLFYRYVRLISRNEVGSNPACLSLSVEAFHASCRRRLHACPDTMLATATHDHKRGEDTRMRIAVLSEIPDEWVALVHGWFEEARGKAGPDRTDALMLYQTLVGIWPLDGRPKDLSERVVAWFVKALREGKRHTDWLDPNETYEKACCAYVERLLDSASSSNFQRQMTGFVQFIAPAAALNSLSQTLLRLTVPGMPDLYQGCDLWDFSLVDPDNRRSVDFSLREKLLDSGEDPEAYVGKWETGAIKQALIRALLACRREYPLLFARGSYEPIPHCGPHRIAFRRVHETAQLLVVAPRHTLALTPDPVSLSVSSVPEPVVMPADCRGAWRSVLRPDRTLLVGEEPVSLWMEKNIPVECFIKT